MHVYSIRVQSSASSIFIAVSRGVLCTDTIICVLLEAICRIVDARTHHQVVEVAVVGAFVKYSIPNFRRGVPL